MFKFKIRENGTFTTTYEQDGYNLISLVEGREEPAPRGLEHLFPETPDDFETIKNDNYYLQLYFDGERNVTAIESRFKFKDMNKNIDFHSMNYSECDFVFFDENIDFFEAYGNVERNVILIKFKKNDDFFVKYGENLIFGISSNSVSSLIFCNVLFI